MDHGITRFIDKLWPKMNEMARLVGDPEALINYIYDHYHGADANPHNPDGNTSGYSSDLEELKAAVRATKDGYVQADAHDYVFARSLSDDPGDEEWRVYLNARAESMLAVALYIVNTLWPADLGRSFKVASKHEDFEHYDDPLVIYCRNEGEAMTVARTITSSPVFALLSGKQPAMTRLVAPSIGVGQSPKNFKISFGKLRAVAIAKAVIAYTRTPLGAGEGKPRRYFDFLVELSLRQVGVDTNVVCRNSTAQMKNLDLAEFMRTPLQNVVLDWYPPTRERSATAQAGSKV